MGALAARAGLVPLLLMALSLGSPEASAQGTPVESSGDQRAKELFQNGAILYEEGRYEDAIAAWQEAYRLSARPLLLYNIANAQERVGRWREALETLNRYRAFATAEERALLDRRIVNLERRLKEQGEETAANQRESGGQSDADNPPKERAKGRFPVGPVVVMGVGVGAIGVGTGFGLRAIGARSDAAGLCSAQGGVCPAEAQGALNTDRSSSLIADIGFGVGGAAILGGGLWLLLDGARPVGPALRVRARPGGLLLDGRF